jgi:phage baseplate assembly protein W
MGPDFIGRGWSFPLDVNPTGTIAMAGGARKLEQAMRLVLSTFPGERPYRPEFGCKLRSYVFEGGSVDVLGRIAAEVRASLTRWEPRVNVDEVIVHPDAANEALLHIDITYTAKGENDPRNLVYPFYTIPEDGE